LKKIIFYETISNTRKAGGKSDNSQWNYRTTFVQLRVSFVQLCVTAQQAIPQPVPLSGRVTQRRHREKNYQFVYFQ
jgi:hypothetical protein